MAEHFAADAAPEHATRSEGPQAGDTAAASKARPRNAIADRSSAGEALVEPLVARGALTDDGLFHAQFSGSRWMNRTSFNDPIR